MLNAAKTNDNESPDYSHIFSSGEPKKNVASKVLKYLLKANLKVFIISVILFIIKNAAPYVLPIITSEVINVATNPAEREITELAFYGGLIIFLVVQNLYTHMVYVKYSSRALRNIGAGFRNSLVKKLQQISLVYQKEFKTGALQSKFIRDIETIEGFLDNIMLVLMPAVLSLLVTTSVTLVKSPIVALFFILVVPVNVAVIRHFRKPLGEVNRSFRQTMEKTSAKMSNMIEMIPVTKAHGLEETEVRRLEHDINDLKMAALSMDYISGRFGSSAWVASQLMNICCLLFTGVLAYYGKISVGEVVLYQSYFTTITANVSALLNIAPAFAKGSEAINSVSEVIFSDEIEDNKGKIRLRYVHGSIDFQNVSYRYPGAEEDTIKNLSLSVNPGECIAFVGSSGSGKTTVMNMIIGFLKANSGQLLIDGKPIELINLTDYRHFLSVVPQNCVL
ncbi:MAG: ABC transporter ATP-binding protein, partial [Clostridia bacterium]|nr:ABC transporter ATP-binding protein [Clostridia bacterium]